MQKFRIPLDFYNILIFGWSATITFEYYVNRAQEEQVIHQMNPKQCLLSVFGIVSMKICTQTKRICI